MPLDKDLERVAELTDKKLTSDMQTRVADLPTQPTKAPKKNKKTTVKTGDTYDSIAKQTGYDVQSLVTTKGNPKNLKAGQIINLPPDPIRYPTQPVHPDHRDTTIPQIPQQPQVPNLPGYGGTVADYRQAGANVTGQKDIAGYESFIANERESEEDNWYMQNRASIRSAFRNLSPLAKGPNADQIRERYRRLLAAEERMATGGGGQRGELFNRWFGSEDSMDDQLRDYMNQPSATTQPLIEGPEQYALLQEENQQLTGQGTIDMAVNWFQKFMGQKFNPDFTPRTPETLGDVRAQQAMQRRGDAMQDYWTSRPTGVGGEGQPAAQDDYPDDPYRNPAYENTGAEPPGIYDITYNGPNGTVNAPDGWVYYNGKAIRQDLFLDYLNSQERPADLNSDYWQKQVFVRGAAKNMEALAYGVTHNDRDALPIFLTPAMLELMGTNRTMEEWADLLRNQWGYLWDPEQGGWVKRVDDGGGTSRTGTGGGDRSGYGGRPRRGRGTSGTRGGPADGKEITTSSYARGKGGTPIRGDRRGLPGVGSQAQVSWRI